MSDDRTRIGRAAPHPAPAPSDEATRIATRAAHARPPAAAGAAPDGEPTDSGFKVARWNSQSAAQIGEVLGNTYLIEDLLGRGGMGAVYRARHTILDSAHAIKIILSELADDPDIIALLDQEANALRLVKHDAVVEYQGLFLDEHKRRYLVMEFVDGPSLAAVLKERRFTPEEVRRLKNRLALGLAAAHDKGIYHRDISPDNIILPEGRIDNAKIIDFGIAKFAGAERSVVSGGGGFAGKYSYASPEHYGGTIDGRSDIYSLGLVLAAAAIGHGGKVEMGAAIVARQAVPDLGRVPEELRGEIAKLLQPDPKDRPQSMLDVVDPAVLAEVSGLSQTMRESILRAAAGAPAPSRAARLVLLGAAGVLGLVGLLAAGHVAYPQVLLGLFGTDTAAVQAEVQHRLGVFRCATLSTTVSQDYLFRVNVRVTGVVAAQGDADKIDELAHLRNVSKVSSAVDVEPWPFCDAINLVRTAAGGGDARTAPRIASDHPDFVFKNGERLVLKVTSTPLFDGYLYVDYIDQDGNVAHMLPHPRRTDNKVTAGQEVTLGAARGERDTTEPAYEIAPPFGTQMILATASRQPLFDAPRPQFETAAAYLDALRGAVAKAREGGGQPTVAAYHFMKTAPAD